MAFLKSSTAGGKKQAPTPGPNSAAYKKIVAAKKAAGGRASGKGRKRARVGTAFSSLKSRQMLVDRVKRQIWAAVVDINEAIISLAKAGNFTAAKALFDFAGVYSLPEPEDENAKATEIPAAASVQVTEKVVHDPVDAFFRSIGVPPSCAEPEAKMAGAHL